MKTGLAFDTFKQLQQLINTLEVQYGHALNEDGNQAMIEACGGLCIAYSALGNGALAKKWAEQYLLHLAECTGGSFFAPSEE